MSSSLAKKGILIEIRSMSLEDIMLDKISQSPKEKILCSFIYKIYSKVKFMEKQTEGWLSETYKKEDKQKLL